MPGELLGDTVTVKDQKEASQLYNRGNYGYPLSGGGSELDLSEALYLVECDRLRVMRNGKDVSFDELFREASKTIDAFDVKYQVYRDIRSRGFVVKNRTGKFDMAVYPRGKTVSDSRPEFMVRAVSERMELDITDFSSEILKIRDQGYEILYGVGDEEGDVTYYKMSVRNPKGSVFPGKVNKVAKGTLAGDRVFVFNDEDRDVLKTAGYFGKDVGEMHQLSLIESRYLLEKGMLEVFDNRGNKLTFESIWPSDADEDLSLRSSAYFDLRSRGLVVKTGFKYGTHFRVYEGSPDESHARYLVHAVSASDVATWPEISRTVRLSGGVKKNILFCRIGDKTEYYEFKWFRP